MAMKFNKAKFEKSIKDSLAKETKKFLQKKGVENVKQVGSKGIIPIFKGDIPADKLINFKKK